MRIIRLIFVLLLAVILIGIALANRDITTLNLFPAQFDQYLGGHWSLTLPLFLVIFIAMLFGVMVGLIWEWLREAHLRTESRTRANEVARLEREVGQLRSTHATPRDDVLAIVDGPRNGSRPGNLPARR